MRVIFVTMNGTISANQKNDGAEFARDVLRTPGVRTMMPIGMFNFFPIGAGPDCPHTDTAEEMRCEITAYIKADPAHINVPIAIRKLTRDASQWIEHSKPCDDEGK